MAIDRDALRAITLPGFPDTEADSFHHYREKLCLIQLSDTERDYIIDPLKVKDLSPLAEVLSNPAIVKVLRGTARWCCGMRRTRRVRSRSTSMRAVCRSL